MTDDESVHPLTMCVRGVRLKASEVTGGGRDARVRFPDKLGLKSSMIFLTIVDKIKEKGAIPSKNSGAPAPLRVRCVTSPPPSLPPGRAIHTRELSGGREHSMDTPVS